MLDPGGASRLDQEKLHLINKQLQKENAYIGGPALRCLFAFGEGDRKKASDEQGKHKELHSEPLKGRNATPHLLQKTSGTSERKNED